MTCTDARENAVLHLAGELPDDEVDRLARHLADCEPCRREAEGLERAWQALGGEPLPDGSADHRRRTLAAMEEAAIARRVVPISRRAPSFAGNGWLLRAAALVVAAAGGFLVARALPPGGAAMPNNSPGTTPTPTAAASSAADVVPASFPSTDPATGAGSDVTPASLAATSPAPPPSPSDRVAVTVDLGPKVTVVGHPQDPALAAILASLVAGRESSEGTRGKAIDLVSRTWGTVDEAPPAVVAALAEALERDANPGVRKKAAEALAALPPTPAIRDALTLALAKDTNPAVRIAAVEGLAKTAARLRDPATIATLRERAADPAEAGFVRVRAATALGSLSM